MKHVDLEKPTWFLDQVYVECVAARAEVRLIRAFGSEQFGKEGADVKVGKVVSK